LSLNYGYRPWHAEGKDLLDSPILKALDAATGTEAEAILRDLELLCFHGLRTFGPGEEVEAPPVDVRRLIDTEGLWELRIRTPGRSFRLLIWVDDMCRELLLLLLYVKKSRRLPPHTRRLAEKRRTSWLSHHNHGLRVLKRLE